MVRRDERAATALEDNRRRRTGGATQPVTALVLLTFLALGHGACMQIRYVPQAVAGQAELWNKRQPLASALGSGETDARTRALLAEVAPILDFARVRRLDSKGNYQHFVNLERDAVVWFMTACAPLAFEPLSWWFPIAGSFPYLGWFDRRTARRERRRLEKRGYDVYVRPVLAYSTAGWFQDPILSTMLLPSDDAVTYLANVLFHELTHANFFIPNQSVFNESIATFVGDKMTRDYLEQRFGAHSRELADYLDALARDRKTKERLAATYEKLAELYASNTDPAAKLRRKAELTSALEQELDLPFRPNNAFLIGFKTYNSGHEDIELAFRDCGSSWTRFFAVLAGVSTADFPSEQLEAIEPVLAMLRGRCSTQKI